MERDEKILVVDNELGIREGCKRVLVDEGYSVDCAEDGRAGLKKVQENEYDLVLVDLKMPGMGGLDLIGQIHKIDPEIVTIVITGYASIESAVEATKRGAYDYLPKPFSPAALNAVVKRGLEKRALRLEALKLYQEREQKLLELASEKSKLRTIISCMTDGVLVTNIDKRLVLWNTVAVKMLHMTGTDIPGKPLDHYIKNKKVIDSLQDILDSDYEKFSVISREIDLDDEKVVMANVGQVKDENGRVLGIVTVLSDITELKKIDRIKSQFVSMVAHEIRAPLAAIEGWLEVVLSGEAGGDQQSQKRWLERAKERAHSLLSLVNDLLIINKMEARKVEHKKGPVDIADIVNKTVEFLKPEASRREITIKIKSQDGLSHVQADLEDMEKLFTNLISNSIKYNIKGGKINISMNEDESYVCIRIEDTGIGISKEDLPHIFDDFFRADDERMKNIPGTGLGLTIAKKIVDSHNGRIEVESEPGRGSLFSVYLPCESRTRGKRKDSSNG